ncbi:hypothetical protein St703_27410 [Sporolactobacillus terrae]|uniref:Uncharacterized protein n=1 Tax=Sporolactobacillus terrae TaxID=269673 RepID=A0A5K7X8L2_9BACL|nr:hypothetical protein St703_27410 [Sporolactobacillus terrae]
MNNEPSDFTDPDLSNLGADSRISLKIAQKYMETTAEQVKVTQIDSGKKTVIRTMVREQLQH